MESVERSRGEMRSSEQLSGELSATRGHCFPGQEEHPFDVMEAVHPVFECPKATNVLEARVEPDSDHDTVRLQTKRAAVGSKSLKCQKKCDLKMSAEELNETKRRISNDIISAVREIKHSCYQSRKKKIQTSSPVVHKIPSFESGMQIVEHHGTQKLIKLGKIQIDLIALDDILAVFPHLRSGGSEVQTLNSSNCINRDSLETAGESTQAVVVKKCQDVRTRHYHNSLENANPWMRAPHFCFCDAQVESVRIIVSKFRISISVNTSIIVRPGTSGNRHPLHYFSESWTDINNHHSMNPWRFGVCMPVLPPPNGWFPSEDTD
jgi:hypothetical protein